MLQLRLRHVTWATSRKESQQHRGGEGSRPSTTPHPGKGPPRSPPPSSHSMKVHVAKARPTKASVDSIRRLIDSRHLRTRRCYLHTTTSAAKGRPSGLDRCSGSSNNSTYTSKDMRQSTLDSTQSEQPRRETESGPL